MNWRSCGETGDTIDPWASNKLCTRSCTLAARQRSCCVKSHVVLSILLFNRVHALFQYIISAWLHCLMTYVTGCRQTMLPSEYRNRSTHSLDAILLLKAVVCWHVTRFLSGIYGKPGRSCPHLGRICWAAHQ